MLESLGETLECRRDYTATTVILTMDLAPIFGQCREDLIRMRFSHVVTTACRLNKARRGLCFTPLTYN